MLGVVVQTEPRSYRLATKLSITGDTELWLYKFSAATAYLQFHSGYLYRQDRKDT